MGLLKGSVSAGCESDCIKVPALGVARPFVGVLASSSLEDMESRPEGAVCMEASSSMLLRVPPVGRDERFDGREAEAVWLCCEGVMLRELLLSGTEETAAPMALALIAAVAGANTFESAS